MAVACRQWALEFSRSVRPLVMWCFRSVGRLCCCRVSTGDHLEPRLLLSPPQASTPLVQYQRCPRLTRVLAKTSKGSSWPAHRRTACKFRFVNCSSSLVNSAHGTFVCTPCPGHLGSSGRANVTVSICIIFERRCRCSGGLSYIERTRP